MADTPTCAYCRTRPVDEPFRPFCSQRCQMLDLGRWVDGTYRVAVEKQPDASADAGEDDGDESGE